MPGRWQLVFDLGTGRPAPSGSTATVQSSSDRHGRSDACGRWRRRCAVLLARAAAAAGAAVRAPFTAPRGRAPSSRTGPWPPPCAARPEQSRLRQRRRRSRSGERLFFDPRLSRDRHARLRDAATCRRAPSPTAAARAAAWRRVDRNTLGARQRAPGNAGSAGTAPPTACGRRACGRSLDPRRWAATPRRLRRGRARRRRRSPPPIAAAFGAPPPRGRRAGAGRTSPRRSPRSRRRSSPGRTPFDEFRDALGARRRRRRGALPGRRAARPRASSSARGAAASATSGPPSPTASSTTSASRSSPSPGRVDPGRHEGIARAAGEPLQPARAATTTTRRAQPRRDDPPRRAAAPQLRRVQDAVAAQRRAAPRPTCTTAASPRCATSCATTRSSTWSGCTPTASASCGRCSCPPREIDDLVAFLESLLPSTPPRTP